MLAKPDVQLTAVSALHDAVQARLADGDIDIPMLPKVTAAVMALTQDPSADMASLARLIQQDPALASRVMKIANSPLYRGVTPMASLQQAIARLGMTVMSQLALAASIGAKVFDAPGFEQQMQALWRHSIASAGWSREIARLKRTNVESAFLCGLLHQIGKPVVLQLITELTPTPPDADVLGRTLETFYVPAGVQLADAWELPAMVATTISCHNNYAADNDFPQETLIVAAASLLANNIESTTGEVFQLLNLYDEDIEVLIKAETRVNAMAEAMSL